MNYFITKKQTKEPGDFKLFFFLKGSCEVFESNVKGDKCGIYYSELLGLKGYKVTLTLPKYITKTL